MADPDIQTLRLFLSIFDLKNLTRAAQRHNIAPSAVTKRIRDLERHYAVKLFERQSRGVSPTYAGEELARHVGDLFSRLDRLKGTMSEFSLGARRSYEMLPRAAPMSASSRARSKHPRPDNSFPSRRSSDCGPADGPRPIWPQVGRL